MNVTMRAMRTIKKYGSLDNYLLKVRTKWLGERAMWLRTKLQDRGAKVEENRSAGKSIAKPITLPLKRPKTELELASDRLLVVKGYVSNFFKLVSSTYASRNRPRIELRRVAHDIEQQSDSRVPNPCYFISHSTYNATSYIEWLRCRQPNGLRINGANKKERNTTSNKYN